MTVTTDNQPLTHSEVLEWNLNAMVSALKMWAAHIAESLLDDDVAGVRNAIARYAELAEYYTDAAVSAQLVEAWLTDRVMARVGGGLNGYLAVHKVLAAGLDRLVDIAAGEP